MGAQNSVYRAPMLWQAWEALPDGTGPKGYYNGAETPVINSTQFAFVVDPGDADWSNENFSRNYRTLLDSDKNLGAPVPPDGHGGYWPRKISAIGMPICIYMAADFTGIPAQSYSTNRLTISIYHR